MTKTKLIALMMLALLAPACDSDNDDDDGAGVGGSGVKPANADPTGPGALATDKRAPELGSNPAIVRNSKIAMSAALAQTAATGPVIEAKFELDDKGKLSLSLYPTGKGLDVDAQRNVFQELAGDPTLSPFKGELSPFADQEHLTRSARDLTLVQLSTVSLQAAVDRVAKEAGPVVWAIPTIQQAHAGYGVYYLAADDTTRYRFVDGAGSHASNAAKPVEIPGGPGSLATDQRTPELGSDLSVLKTSKITMSQALAQLAASSGPMIEAKFERGDNEKLSLSLYPVGKGIETDSERNTFFELAGDPTAAKYSPEKSEFKVPDAEHLTRASRDLTLVQTAGVTLEAAVKAVEAVSPGGFVYWAIPTIRETRSGYGIYVYGADGKSHYFFVS